MEDFPHKGFVNEDTTILINCNYGGFPHDGLQRTDAQIIFQCGFAAEGRIEYTHKSETTDYQFKSELRAVTIPANHYYEIDEYDGYETIVCSLSPMFNL